MTNPASDVRRRSSPLTSLESMARRVSIPIMGLTAVGCAVRENELHQAFWTTASFISFLLAAVMVFLLCLGFVVLMSARRRQRTLAKILVALVAGSVCGALWILLIDTVVSSAIPEAMTEPAVLGVGVVTALAVTTLLLRGNPLGKVVELSLMAIGFHSLALPIAALISVLVGGAQSFPAASLRPAFRAVALGIGLAGDLRTVGLSVGGLLLGLVLVFIGDRVRRTARTRHSSPRFDLSG
ncbi:MAG TPA: hypothetical protein VL086_13845 [Candidatus Nitrosotalea sp.]|nr:hypothetical protein [Candidatus Nitrosotalea sp.]